MNIKKMNEIKNYEGLLARPELFEKRSITPNNY